MAPAKKSATTEKPKAAKPNASTAKASMNKASTAKANAKVTTASQPRTRTAKHVAVDDKENVETNSAKDKDNPMEDNDVAEPKMKSKMLEAQPVNEVADTDAKAAINKAPAPQRIATQAANSNQHPGEQRKALDKK